MFVGAWVMTSLGLHQLLLHYGHRPAAKRAAWTKFTISRIGDVALMASIAIIFAEFKTLGFPQLFTAAESITTVTPAMVVASSLLVIGAITKSAQFPFHTWLPQTMETPTPVSALMHAGIVNAGGYLIIRTSPIVSLSPWALTCLAIIGGVTACFGAVVMLTQTSVKKTLAYSTIAQMGFMMLQCGLGAYSAAMLHILAHSLYKAHAFLSSGSVMSDRTAVAGCKSSTQPVSVIKLATVSAAIVGLLMLAFTILGVDAANKPGGLLLGGVLCLAMTQWVGQVMAVGDSRRVLGALAIAAGMCTAYVASFAVVDKIVAASLPPSTAPELGWLVVAVVTTGFVGMFVLQIRLRSSNHSARLATWRIHAANGFYVENMLRRVFGSLETN
jgi:NAD(P)H-quinone oxidoreductase subunit 5